MNKQIKPSVAAVKRLRPFGWSDFKHKLHRAGVIPSPVADVPDEWVSAFLKTYRT
jgi:hypothetical protein